MPPVIHWFRRDLRLSDNTALNAAAASGAPIIPVYILSQWQQRHDWTGAPRQEFLCGALRSLAANLEAKGGRLIIREGNAEIVLRKLIKESGATALHFNRDPDPFGREQESKILKLADELGIRVHAHQDVAIHERDEVRTATGGVFRVFTPYAKAWMKLDKPAVGRSLSKLVTPDKITSLPLPTLAHWGLRADATIIESGEAAARKRMARFLDGAILHYLNRRDLPAESGTSRLSQDLRFGLLSVRELYTRCLELAEKANAEQRRSLFTFINELIWREFYLQVLWHWPEVLDHEFQPKYRALHWNPPGAAFESWCEGQTGFPIIDAGMRELRSTGHMHNRLRMLTAMFLVKDLHISWKAGEQWFMQRLVDGEIASNNGGWQWSAGTGTDAAPYFRIQNPWTQTKRFDPEGIYIKRWVPELRDVPAAKLQQPPTAGLRLAKNYPPPMVDHAVERDVTLELYRR